MYGAIRVRGPATDRGDEEDNRLAFPAGSVSSRAHGGSEWPLPVPTDPIGHLAPGRHYPMGFQAPESRESRVVHPPGGDGDRPHERPVYRGPDRPGASGF